MTAQELRDKIQKGDLNSLLAEGWKVSAWASDEMMGEMTAIHIALSPKTDGAEEPAQEITTPADRELGRHLSTLEGQPIFITFNKKHGNEI